MRKLPLLALLLLFAGFVTGCRDIDDGYNRLDKNGLTQEIRNIVPQNVIDEMQSLGFPIHGGANPPLIEGTYLASPVILVGSNISTDTPGHQFTNYSFKFFNQNNAYLTIEMQYVNGSGNTTGVGSGGYVTGNGNSFSAFFQVRSTATDGTISDMVLALSGTVVEGGIQNLYIANFMTDDHGDPNNNLIANGQGRVSYDSDGFSEDIGGRPANNSTHDKINTSSGFDLAMEL